MEILLGHVSVAMMGSNLDAQRGERLEHSWVVAKVYQLEVRLVPWKVSSMDKS